MRISGTINGLPAIVIGAASGPDGMKLIAMVGDSRILVAVGLDQFMLPKIPKRLRRKMKAFIDSETKSVQRETAERIQ